MAGRHVVLIPGFWLDAASWARVTAALEAAGHRAHPVTPLGVGPDAGREEVTLADQAAAVADLVDSLDGPVVLVGHSGGGAVAHAVADARPERVVRVVYVDSGPLGDGQVVNAELPVVDGAVPLPEWSVFDPGELRDLSEEVKARFRERALPVPVGVARGPQRLRDERRYAVPVTVVTCTMPESMLRELMLEGHPYVAELARIREVDVVELPTGHWPQLSRPADLAAVVLRAVQRADEGPPLESLERAPGGVGPCSGRSAGQVAAAATVGKVELVLAERLVLLALDDAKGRDSTSYGSDAGVAAALLLDLSQRHLLDVGADGKLTALDGPAPRHPVLDAAYRLIRTSAKRRTAKGWVDRLPRELKPLREGLARGLAARGILTEHHSKVLGIFEQTRFPQADPEPERELRESLVDVLVGGRTPTADEALLVGLLEPLGMVDRVVPKESRRAARKRAKDIGETGLAGDAVRDSVRAVQAAVATAAIMPAIAAGSSGS